MCQEQLIKRAVPYLSLAFGTGKRIYFIDLSNKVGPPLSTRRMRSAAPSPIWKARKIFSRLISPRRSSTGVWTGDY